MSKESIAQSLPWIEKYRPKKIDDVAHQDEVVRALKSTVITGNLPHLLFYGPPGTGKTSTILAVAKELFGGEFYKSRVLELNASHERGIDVVRTSVKNFAQLAVKSHMRPDGKPMPNFKLIILDEADSMTSDAQSALRRTMETWSKVTRFCLICNYVSRIIEPLASRCAKFRFRPLDQSSIIIHLQMISEQEKSAEYFSRPVLDMIVSLSEGDMRKAISTLQSLHRLYASRFNKSDAKITNSEVSVRVVQDLAGVVPMDEIKVITDAIKSNSFDKLVDVIQEVIASGYSVAQIIQQLHELMMDWQELTNLQRSKISIELARAEHCLIEGADEYLQLLHVTAFWMKAINAHSW
eukprot:TRINITY_DN12404_c0_g1_i1.p1 TRINITY_DN12404_c0_g1~~TRINITY_DN12404_c0_g1_i1.p1  ORF type:complete len:383 (-),score=115.85 TRINITY_DN12404_c0_g1_i1:78-1133(-)